MKPLLILAILTVFTPAALADVAFRDNLLFSNDAGDELVLAGCERDAIVVDRATCAKDRKRMEFAAVYRVFEAAFGDELVLRETDVRSHRVVIERADVKLREILASQSTAPPYDDLLGLVDGVERELRIVDTRLADLRVQLARILGALAQTPDSELVAQLAVGRESLLARSREQGTLVTRLNDLMVRLVAAGSDAAGATFRQVARQREAAVTAWKTAVDARDGAMARAAAAARALVWAAEPGFVYDLRDEELPENREASRRLDAVYTVPDRRRLYETSDIDRHVDCAPGASRCDVSIALWIAKGRKLDALACDLLQNGFTCFGLKIVSPNGASFAADSVVSLDSEDVWHPLYPALQVVPAKGTWKISGICSSGGRTLTPQIHCRAAAVD